MKIVDQCELLSASGQAFSLYRLPGEEIINMAIGLLSDEQLEGNYFIVHPFVKAGAAVRKLGKAYLGPLSGFHFEELEPKIARAASAVKTKSTSSEHYLEQCERALHEIRKGKLQKIVLHTEKHMVTKRSASELFVDALTTYPDAMVHWTHIPGENDWIGASPELLLSKKGFEYRSMSLAGTRTYEGDTWTDKEFREQDMVTEFMTESLEKLGVNDIVLSDRYDRQAGHLIHLCNDIFFKTTVNEIDILDALHPTPAVCGSPRKEALELMTALNMQDRSFYCGYIGIRSDQYSVYYVNLRCIELSQGEAIIYVGGGITSDSNPQAELEELNQKSQIMGKLLERDD